MSDLKKVGLSFEQNWILFAKGFLISVLSLVKIGLVVLEKKKKMRKVYNNNNNNDDGQRTNCYQRSSIEYSAYVSLNTHTLTQTHKLVKFFIFFILFNFSDKNKQQHQCKYQRFNAVAIHKTSEPCYFFYPNWMSVTSQIVEIHEYEKKDGLWIVHYFSMTLTLSLLDKDYNFLSTREYFAEMETTPL